MKDYMISMFIDDELDFDEKIELVESVHGDAAVKNEIIHFLQQEKLIRSPVVNRIPVVKAAVRPKLTFYFRRSAAAFVSGLAAALIIVFFVLFRFRFGMRTCPKYHEDHICHERLERTTARSGARTAVRTRSPEGSCLGRSFGRRRSGAPHLPKDLGFAVSPDRG